MENISTSLKFFLNLTMTQALIARRFDARLSFHSLSLNDFMILFHLSQAPDEKLRRIDLAEKVGLSASAITKKISPLEKIGMVEKEANARDARVSLVKLAKGGKRILEEAMSSAEMAAEELYPKEKEQKLEASNQVLIELGGSVR
ncbi:MarR family winged helix-turn-helix transcriptional regulator [Rhodohalobacter sp. SW132]|uniref:MarR family winged helix-turn-helix transcriptional regulator n=1 Tax=Rhodohalobacter sp. SW132 TaxID=2293433 RepID=UPI0018F7BD6D|nr:MarR family transcriptional regulator [Rhodohalobacter sp. SW132]